MIVQTLLGSSAEPDHLTTLEAGVRVFAVVGVTTVLLVLIRWLAGRASLRQRRLGGFQDLDTLPRGHAPEPALDQALRFWGGASDLREVRLFNFGRSGRIRPVRRR